MVDMLTGRVTLLASSSGTFGTEVSFYGNNVAGSGSVVVTDNNITVTGLSYTEFHTVRVVATSAVCPGVLNSSITDVPVMFNIRSEWTTWSLYLLQLLIFSALVLTQLTGFVDCSNSSLPISGSWSLMERVSEYPVVKVTTV